MQQTNNAFMSSRRQYLDAQRTTSVASTKTGTPSRLDYSKKGTTAISQANKLKSKMHSDKPYIQNTQSAHSFLKFQQEDNMGNQEIFSKGVSFISAPTQETINRFESSASRNNFQDVENVLQSSLTNTNTWRSAGNGDADSIVLTLGPGVEMKYDILIGTSNLIEPTNTGSNTQLNLVSENGVIRISNLDEGSSSAQLSIHVETRSLGGISDIEFESQFFDTQLDTDATRDPISLKAIGLETLEQLSIDSMSEAIKTPDKLVGVTDSVGELECISGNWPSPIASAFNRIDSELSAKQSSTLYHEITLGRIIHSDMSEDTTNVQNKCSKWI